MKSFKEFTKKKQISWLDVPAFAETRHLVKSDNSSVSIKEVLEQYAHVKWKDWTRKAAVADSKSRNLDDSPFEKIHEHPSVIPEDTDDHVPAIEHYTATPTRDVQNGHRSSSNINRHLRHLAGESLTGGPGPNQGIAGPHTVEKVRGAIADLSKTFRRTTTNKIPVTTYTGVPKRVGEKLEKAEEGSEHHFPGFTSSSSAQQNAHEFARHYKSTGLKDAAHVIQFHAEPGSVRSFAHHSRFNEHEFGIHHGARATYSHTTEHKETDGTTTKVHHMILHADHLSIDDYPKMQGN